MPKVFVITGPSGVGKGTLIRELRSRMPELALSVSATTRRPRPGERDGVDYHFLTHDEFDRRVEAGMFLEHADYSGNRYGTLRPEVTERLEGGESVLLEIEVQGARQVRAAMAEAVLVFIAPPNLQELRRRLKSRGADSEEEMAARLRTAEVELRAQPEFQHVVVNDEIDRATDELEGVARAELS